MRAPPASKAEPQTEVDADKPEVRRGRVKSKRKPELEVVLGARLRAARVAAQMSQTALGATVGISFQQVQKYELGKDRIAASTLQNFAAALGVHPGSFYGDDMPAPAGSIPDVKAVMRIAEVAQRVHSPLVLKRLVALMEVLA